MPIYKGSTKLGTVYHGGTKIGKVYKGSTLIYQNEINIPLNFYKQANQSLFENYTINKAVAGSKALLGVSIATLKSVNGTLGTPESSITISSYTSDITLNSPFVTEVFGLTFYQYKTTDGAYCIVSPKQKSGDYVLYSIGRIDVIINSSGSSYTRPDSPGTNYALGILNTQTDKIFYFRN